MGCTWLATRALMKSTGDWENARKKLRRLEASWTLLSSPATFWSSCKPWPSLSGIHPAKDLDTGTKRT